MPVVYTTDKKCNNIDKLACSEFWEEKDSYRRLQDAFYQYMTSHNFELERGVPKEEAEKYQKEKNKIMADNRDLHKQLDNIKAEYKEKEDKLEWKYDYKISSLEKENSYLHNVIDKFRETIHKFIEWICVNFDMGTGDTLIRDFEKETRTCLDGEEQIKREEKEKDLEMER